uniref:TATA-binding protein interacting (TIP20) domain-containing protein n=1 Tax=Picocystis salinarum TaxID=88271 RepID=A0A6U9RIX6_9CHLO
MSHANVRTLLDKAQSHDKDYRYMAWADLAHVVEDPTVCLDVEWERTICTSVVRGVDDPIGEVSNMAQQCLVPLVARVHEEALAKLVQALVARTCTERNGNARERNGQDAGQQAAVGAKNVLTHVECGSRAHAAVQAAAPWLQQALERERCETDVLVDVLDVIHVASVHCGTACKDAMNQWLPGLRNCLMDRRSTVRKRAMHAIAALSPHMDEDTHRKTCRDTVEGLQRHLPQSQGGPQGKTTHLHMAGSLVRQDGERMNAHVEDLLPALLQCMRDATELAEQEEDVAVEQLELSLQALEAMVRKCNPTMRPHVDDVMTIGIEYLKYDPNYHDETEAEETRSEGAGSQGEEGDYDGSDDGEEEDEYSDDEDTSWKVRRAAAKLLSAIVQSMPDKLCYLYENLTSTLLQRMKEREENVRVDVYQVLVDLLRQTGVSDLRSAKIPQKPGHYLQQALPPLLHNVNKELRGKSGKGKLAALQLLHQLVTCLPGGLAEHVKTVLPELLKMVAEEGSASNIKIEALVVVRLLLDSHDAWNFRAHVHDLSKVLLDATKEKYYRVTAEALRCCRSLAVLLKLEQDGGEADRQDLVPQLYSCVLFRLSEQDQDLLVKEEAIRCMATVVSCLHKSIGEQVHAGLQVMLDRTRNEVTRLTAIKAFGTIALSPARECITPLVQPLIEELTALLRKADRRLRQASLHALDAIVKTASSGLDIMLCDTIIIEVAGVLSDSDLHMCAMALSVLSSIVSQQPCCAAAVSDSALKPTFELLKSPLLQGSVLEPMQRLFSLLVRSEQPETSFDSLYIMLVEAGRVAASRQQIHSVAKIIASLCTAAGDGACRGTVDALVDGLRTLDDNVVVSLYCLGEIGKLRDLDLFASSEAMIRKCFESPLEEVKSAASFALGCMVAGNAHKHLPELVAQIESSPKQEYLLLHALKEVIVTLSDTSSKGTIVAEDYNRILQILLEHAKNEEEGIRNVVAECLGKLVLMGPEDILVELEAATGSENSYLRATVATSVRFAVLEKPHPVDQWLRPRIPAFLGLIEDSTWFVRKAAIQTLSSIVHVRMDLLGDSLVRIMPAVYKQTAVLPELVRTVDLGPFKHVVDDGLELRKATFECLSTIMENCFEVLNVDCFVSCLKEGIADHYDVKVPCHLLLAKLAETHGQTVLYVVDALAANLEKTLRTRLKSDAVKQEVDRHEDLLRSALKAIHAMSRIPNIEHQEKFAQMVARTIQSNPAMMSRYEAIQTEGELVEMMDLT